MDRSFLREPARDGTALSRLPLYSEKYIPQVLPAVLKRRDLLAFYTVALFLITNAILSAMGGVVSISYMLLGGVLFLIPCVIATAQLGSMYPHEGSLYNWTYHALGSFWSLFVGLCYWLSSVIAPVTAANVFTTMLQGVNPTWLTEPWQQGCAMSAVLVFCGFLSTRRLTLVRWLILAAAILTVFAAFLTTTAGLIWIATGHPSQTDFGDASSWLISPANFALFGIITLNFIGTSGPLNLAGEINQEQAGGKQKTIMRHLLFGTPLVFLCYLFVCLTFLVVRGPALLEEANPNFAAITLADLVFGQWLGKLPGNIILLCIWFFTIAAIVLYTLASSRLLLAGAIDQRLPVSLGKVNHDRVPVNAVIFQTGSSILVVLLVFVIFPYLILPTVIQENDPIALATNLYTMTAAALTMIWTVATIFFFINLVGLYRRDPEGFRASSKFPMPVIWLAILLGTTACLLTVVGTFYFPWSPAIPEITWRIVVITITVTCLAISFVVSIFATSQASWETMNTPEAGSVQ